MTPTLRNAIDNITYADPSTILDSLIKTADLDKTARARIAKNAADLVREIRDESDVGLMEVFLAEYGLSTHEGIALMCLAEALLRVPDAKTIDALIEDKIAPSDWGHHLGHSSSSLVNASTWALLLTGKVLTESAPGPVGHLRNAIKRLGEPVIRTLTTRAMKEMGRQFVLGEDISKAINRARINEAKGYTYSYDMLGEAARTQADAKHYHLAYSHAISVIGKSCENNDIRQNPGISVKLSALHPRYEYAQKDRVIAELVPRLTSLAVLAKSAGIGLNVDAEEADRLSLSLDVIDLALADPSLKGWDGFGIVVQAYGQRAPKVLDHLYELADRLDRRIMVRLVKGAYWDTEIKRAQVQGVDGFPVFTRKAETDISYIACARKLLGMTDRIYPQFATHNAHTMAAIIEMQNDNNSFEFQKLHGMGDALHEIVSSNQKTRCRIYAPVGTHRDLLAYLVRRLLENGANSSFVNQIVDQNITPEIAAQDPFDLINRTKTTLPVAAEIFLPERPNSRGFDLAHPPTLASIEAARAPFINTRWTATPLLAEKPATGTISKVENPGQINDSPGDVAVAQGQDIDTALRSAEKWDALADERAAILSRAADLIEANHGEFFALLAREAGKTLPDAVSELREAVDFLRYYCARIPDTPAAGVFACISPWNFPLAIFCGQIGAALASGNGVVAKPAAQTPLVAFRIVEIMHDAGVPRSALQLLPGDGSVGAALTSDARIDGVVFTGSTATALKIRANMAENLEPGAPLIAETGGLNAMVVDSTALPEQAIQAIIESAFQSAGQRCSALRCLYLQEDIAEDFIKMLCGAMDELSIANPWNLETDCGPIIDHEAQKTINAHIEKAREHGRLVHQTAFRGHGNFIPPTLIQIDGIHHMDREIFGPVLHLATFKSDDFEQVITSINATGYGLTFGLQTRIDDRVQYASDTVRAGNIYVNRNQIGAVVGSQPFGGEGLSGTGPKAGGPLYLSRFGHVEKQPSGASWHSKMGDIQSRIDNPSPTTTSSISILPGPTGELNQLSTSPRDPLLCLGPGKQATDTQIALVKELGGVAIPATGEITALSLTTLTGFSGVVFWGPQDKARAYEIALSKRAGPIIPLITGHPDKSRTHVERHLCVDTTAAGGNAALLGENM